MSIDLHGRVIRGIDIGNEAFISCWKDLPGNVQDEAMQTIKSLVGNNIDHLPAKLHFHQLTSKVVPSRLDATKKVSAWSLHLTADDRYKASFTYEKGSLYFRICGLHDAVDKRP